MILIAIIICGLTAYASHLNKGYEYSTARYEMSGGNYAEITLMYDHGSILEFSDARIYNKDGIQVDQQWIDPEMTEDTDTYTPEAAEYFIKKYDLKGSSTIFNSDDEGNAAARQYQDIAGLHYPDADSIRTAPAAGFRIGEARSGLPPQERRTAQIWK